jgi:hypothetical protein
MKTPLIGERWKYKERFILEVTSLRQNGFSGIIKQLLPGNDGYFNLHSTSGDSFTVLDNWEYLPGQDATKETT